MIFLVRVLLISIFCLCSCFSLTPSHSDHSTVCLVFWFTRRKPYPVLCNCRFCWSPLGRGAEGAAWSSVSWSGFLSSYLLICCTFLAMFLSQCCVVPLFICPFGKFMSSSERRRQWTVTLCKIMSEFLLLVDFVQNLATTASSCCHLLLNLCTFVAQRIETGWNCPSGCFARGTKVSWFPLLLVMVLTAFKVRLFLLVH